MALLDIRVPLRNLADMDRNVLVRLAKQGLGTAEAELARRDALPKAPNNIRGTPHNYPKLRGGFKDKYDWDSE
jgi:hypothetical protein